MKKTSVFILLLFFLYGFNSCKKDDEEGTANIFYNNIEFNKVIKTSYAQFVLTGSSYSTSSEKDFLIAAFDEDYNKLWAYSHNLPFNQYGNSIVETDDGFLAAGAMESEFGDSSQLAVMKVNTKGDFEWYKNYMGNYSVGGDITDAISDGYVISGGITINDQTSIFALNIDNDGDSLISRPIPGFDYYYGNNIVAANNQYYMSTVRGVFVLNVSLYIIDFFNDDFQCTKTSLLKLADNKIVFYGNKNIQSTIVGLYEDDNLVWSNEYSGKLIQSMASHGNNEIFAVGKVHDSYFDKILITNIDEQGELTFTKSFASNPNEIRYERIGKEVFSLDDNTFLIWENYNGNKLNIYTIDKNGDKK